MGEHSRFLSVSDCWIFFSSLSLFLLPAASAEERPPVEKASVNLALLLVDKA